MGNIAGRGDSRIAHDSRLPPQDSHFELTLDAGTVIYRTCFLLALSLALANLCASALDDRIDITVGSDHRVGSDIPGGRCIIFHRRTTGTLFAICGRATASRGRSIILPWYRLCCVRNPRRLPL